MTKPKSKKQKKQKEQVILVANVQGKQKKQKRKGKRGVTTLPGPLRMQRIGSTKTNSMTLTHSELVSDVAVGPNYNIESYEITPANQYLFPWLNRVATNFDQYQFINLKFIYNPTSTVVTDGQIVLSYDPNAADEPASDMRQAQNTAKYVSTLPYVPVQMAVPVVGGVKFINNNSNETLMTKVGRIDIASDSGSIDKVCGRLTVEYTIRLIRPQLALTVSALVVPPQIGSLSTARIQSGLDSVIDENGKLLVDVPVGYLIAHTYVTNPAGTADYMPLMAPGMTVLSSIGQKAAITSTSIPEFPDTQVTAAKRWVFKCNVQGVMDFGPVGPDEGVIVELQHFNTLTSLQQIYFQSAQHLSNVKYQGMQRYSATSISNKEVHSTNGNIAMFDETLVLPEGSSDDAEPL